MQQWRVGALAAATGLTVRTLHHYEQAGLLAPSGRSEGNHRLYDAADVARLYRIRALRELGLSLAEIGPLLDGEAGGLGAVLRRHLARAEADLVRLTRQRDRLKRLSSRADQPVDTEDLLGLLGAMARLERHAARLRATGRAPRDAERRWRALGEALRAARDAGEGPEAPATAEIARQIQAQILLFTQGDPDARDALSVVRQIDPPEALAGWDADLFRFLEAALRALPAEEAG